MNYDSVLELIKTDMKQAIDAIDLNQPDTFEYYLKLHKSQKRIISELYDLRVIKPKIETPVEAVKPLDNIIKEAEKQINQVDVAEENARQTGESTLEPIEDGFPVIVPLKRVLKGGILRVKPGNSEDATEFIPEHLIRDLNVDHGDLIKVYAKSTRYSTRKYEVAERLETHEEPEDLCVIEQGVVAYNDLLQTYVVDSYITDTGRVERFRIDDHGVSFFKINHKDIDVLDIQAGDIVDAAYYKDKSVVRIRWRHDLQLDPSRTELLNRKKASYYKDKSSSETKDILPVFSGNTIAIAGAPSHETAYKEEIEKRGGEVVFITANTADGIDLGVKNADLVVLPIRESSHRLCESAKAAAKKYDIPFAILDGAGRSLLVRTVSEALDIFDTEG